MIYQLIFFDDFVKEEGGIWSQICSNCHDKHLKNHTVIEIPINNLVCGVKNCLNEADFYIDFICEETGQEKN